MSRSWLEMAALSALVLTSACEIDSLGIDGESGTIQVTVVRGPLNPVGQAGQPDVEPVNGARVSARPAFGDVTRTTSTNAFGFASFQVPAGTWNVMVDACPGALGAPPMATVQVPPGGVAVAGFECDTGIR